MSYELKGTLEKIFDTEQKSGTFQSRDFVIKIEGDHPQYIKFQLVQDRCELLDSCEVGQSYTVYFDLRGREWQGKYFTNLQCWRIDGGSHYDSDQSDKAQPKTTGELPF